MEHAEDTSRAPRPYGWTDWYLFALNELGFAQGESAEYANLRYVEEQNREALHRGDSDRLPHRRTF
ncbi:MAG TPA: hypothetical protein VLV28_07235 [Gaiellaceae bacterium]|nr:hypothetical protein [Gaiellaceae bacterium]